MKLHYTFDSSGKFISSKPSRLSPLDEGVYLLPKNATFKSPPEAGENKKPYWDFYINDWVLKDDKDYLNHLKYIKEQKKKFEFEKIAKELKECDEFGIPLKKLVDNKIVIKNEDELKKERVKLIKEKHHNFYEKLKYKFVMLTCICMTDLSKFTEDNRNALKEFKDNIEQVWNSIDGTKKPEEIIWPDIPEI